MCCQRISACQSYLWLTLKALVLLSLPSLYSSLGGEFGMSLSDEVSHNLTRRQDFISEKRRNQRPQTGWGMWRAVFPTRNVWVFLRTCCILGHFHALRNKLKSITPVLYARVNIDGACNFIPTQIEDIHPWCLWLHACSERTQPKPETSSEGPPNHRTPDNNNNVLCYHSYDDGENNDDDDDCL